MKGVDEGVGAAGDGIVWCGGLGSRASVCVGGRVGVRSEVEVLGEAAKIIFGFQGSVGLPRDDNNQLVNDSTDQRHGIQGRATDTKGIDS